MSTQHANFIALAQKLINKNGRLVTFQKLSSDFNNDGKPWRAAEIQTVESTVDVKAAFLPVAGTDLGTYFEDKELFKRCSDVAMVPIPLTGEDLTQYHLIYDNGLGFKIETIQLLKPGDNAILYFVGLSR